jgi:hypothetical protein
MHHRIRTGAVLLVLATAILWAGCDSGGSVEPASVPAVQFTSDGAGGVPTDSTIQIGVTLTDSIGASVSVEVLFASQASSATFADLGGFSAPDSTTKEVTFSEDAGAGATEEVSVNIANADLSEGSKEAFFALQQLESEGSVEIGEPREFGLSIGAKPIAEARAEGREAILNGNQVTVTIRGTVSRAFGGYARFQDDSGPTGASGMVIRQVGGGLTDQFQQDIADGVIQPGTELLVTGTLSQFSGLLQINGDDLSSYSVISQGDPPEPQTVTLEDIEPSSQGPGGENYMSELIRVEGLSFPDASGSFEGGTTYTVENADGTTFQFRVQGSDETNIAGEPIPEGTFTFEGILGQFNFFSGVDTDEGYQLLPMQASDVKPQ